ncbi:MAG: zf-HC2 domain-containing protein [Bryobacterales bacterium]|nr:zf-HC2 domain-containing protein [Bryobacterales bacterium]
MVTCKDFLREISEFLDDRADPQLQSELKAHITQCPNCWVILDTTLKTIQVYKGMEPQELPEGVHGQLMKALEKRCAAKTKKAQPPPTAQK